MQCFCPAGTFGRNCERPSSIKDGRANFDPKRYELVSSRGVDFYWRMIDESDEVEGVIVGKNTNSYVAVGKRNILLHLIYTVIKVVLYRDTVLVEPGSRPFLDPVSVLKDTFMGVDWCRG